MIGKRDFLKGAMGAAVVLNGSGAKGQGSGHPGNPPQIPYPNANFAREVNTASDLVSDPLSELKSLWVDNALAERERLCEYIERKSCSLARMKSVSDAYKFHMLEVYRKERQTINQRFEEFCNKIWGGPSNGPVGR